MPHTDAAVIDQCRPQKWFAIVQVFSQVHAYLKILTVKVKCLIFFGGVGTIMEQIWNIKTSIAELYKGFENEF